MKYFAALLTIVYGWMFVMLMAVSCGNKKTNLNHQMNTVYLKATSASLKYRNYSTTQMKYIFQGKKDSAKLYEDSAKIYYAQYFIHMAHYDSLQTLFDKK